MNFNNFNEIELDNHMNEMNNEMIKNMYNQNYKIFYMPTIKFDEIEVGKYKVLFIGRNNAYLFIQNNFIPKYHLNETSSKIIFEKVKHKLFKRTKVLNIIYRDYHLEIDVKINEYRKKCKYVVSKYEEYNYYSSDSIMCKQVHLIDYNLNLTSNNIYVLYDEKGLIEDYNKYSKIYFYPSSKTKIVKKNIHKYLPENLNIGNHELTEDEDDEVRTYTPEKGFVKIRIYYNLKSNTEYQENRIYDKEIHDKKDVEDDDNILYRIQFSNIRRRMILLNDHQNLDNKYDLEEEFFNKEDMNNMLMGQIIFEEEEEEDNDDIPIDDDDYEIPDVDGDEFFYWEIDNIFVDENFLDEQYNYLYEIDNLFNYKRINDEDIFIMLEEDIFDE